MERQAAHILATPNVGVAAFSTRTDRHVAREITGRRQQVAANNAWRNHGDKIARLAVFIIGANHERVPSS
jgi:hypothetical protein